jgi:hypothetical protein
VSSCVEIVLEWDPCGGKIITLHCDLDDTLFWTKLLEVRSDTGKLSC